MDRSRILNIADAVNHQQKEYGRVIYGRDALYKAIRANLLPVIRVGKRRLYIPLLSLEKLLQGSLQPKDE